MKTVYLRLAIPTICSFALLLTSLFASVYSSGNAEFRKTRNLVPFELLRNMSADMTKTRNYQAYELLRTMDTDLLKLRNYQAFDLIRTMDTDVTKLRNYQAFQMFDPAELGLAVAVGPILTTDQNGSVADAFNRGDVVQFEFVVENIGNATLTNGLISVQVLDPSATPMFLNYFYETLSPGAHSNYVVGYRIPEEGATGTYTVKAMALTDWPSHDGIGLDIETATFTVS